MRKTRDKQKALKYFVDSERNIGNIIGESKIDDIIRSYYEDALKGDKRARRYFAQLKSDKFIDISPPETFVKISKFLSELMVSFARKMIDIQTFKSLLEACQFKSDLLSREESIEIITEKMGKEKK